MSILLRNVNSLNYYRFQKKELFVLAKKHLLMISILSAAIVFYFQVSWASSPANQRFVPLHSSNRLINTSKQQNTSSSNGKIVGKIINTDGLPLSDITISIQSLTEETINDSVE